MQIKRKIQNWLLKSLLNAITLDEVITYNEKSNQIFINGHLVDNSEAEAMREEAGYLEKTRFWTLMQGTLNEQAKKKLFIEATTPEQMMFAKAMMYNLDVQNKILSIIKKIKS